MRALKYGKLRPSLLTSRDKKKAQLAEEKRVRLAVKKRDRGMCRAHLVERGYPVTGTDMHHIIPRSLGGATDTKNCVWVCHSCHQERHAGVIRITGNGDKEIQVERIWK